MDLPYFHNLHKGETALLVGNGINLHDTPPAWFDYPSIGMNTIHLYDGWTPNYYVTVDSRVMREFGAAIAERFRVIPKFIPAPDLNAWQGENFVRFYHSPARVWPSDLAEGIGFANVMHVAMQIAYYMGFTTLLLIGVHHKPNFARDHFWGVDVGMPGGEPPVADWLTAYKELAQGLAGVGVKVLNISEDTHVSEDILMRGDWRDYAKG